MSIADAGAGLVDAMSQADTSPAGEAEPQAQSEQAPSANQPVAASSETVDVSKLSPYAQNFLAGLPEGERATAARHVSQWDQGFQRYAQERAAEINSYKQLGDLDALRQQSEMINRLRTDPHGFTQALIQAGYGPQQAAQVAQQAAQQQADPYADLPPAVAAQLKELADWKAQQGTENQRLQAALGALHQQMQTRETAAMEAEQDRALQNLLDETKAKHGAFDENWVMLTMSRNPGLTMDAAVQGWKNMLAQYGATPPGGGAPATMSASSAPPAAPPPLDSPKAQSDALVAYLTQLEAQ